jgi:hypothetical protein
VPFLDRSLIFDAEGRPRLAFNVFHPEHEGLFAAGLVQANGSMWRLADYQGQLIANLIVAERLAAARAMRFRERITAEAQAPRRGAFVASDRHRLEVNYYDYRRLLKRLIRSFGAVRNMTLPPPANRPATKPASVQRAAAAE